MRLLLTLVSILLLAQFCLANDPLFDAPVNYDAGIYPSSVFSIDLNGDGHNDLATANAGSDNVSILLGNGDGTFQSAVNYGAGDLPSSVFSIDLNGDGHNDLATANSGSDDVSILLGNGDGTFQSAVNYGTNYNPFSVFSIDLNGDGHNDLATANYGSHDVSILLGNGDGTFQSAVNYGAGDTPYSVISIDLNGDGHNDLATANFYTNNVSILLGNGDGTFGTAVNYTTGSGYWPSTVSVADLDGDGDYDLAVANSMSDNVSILMNLSNTGPSTSCQDFKGIFCDDFEDGVITDWQTLRDDCEDPGTCEWTEDNGVFSNSYDIAEKWFIQSVGDLTWEDYILEADVKGNSGVDKGVVFRIQDANNYYVVNLRSDYPDPGMDQISFDKMVDGVYNADIVIADFPSENGIWYRLKIACLGNDFQISVDDTPGLQYTDNDNPYYTGGIGIACWTGFYGSCDVSFDNVTVTEPEIHLSPMTLLFEANIGGKNPDNQTFTISNSGGGTLEWYIDEQIDWLELDVWQGQSNSAQITVSINRTDLAPGTYNEVMTVTSSNADNSPEYVSIEYTVFLVPVVLIHGWTSDVDVWGDDNNGMISWLKNDFHDEIWAIPIDPCGTEEEDGFENDYDRMFRGNAKIVNEFIEDTLSKMPQEIRSYIKEIDIIGHSMGGLVARRYISTLFSDPWNPQDVRKLIMLGTPNQGSPYAGDWGQLNEWFFSEVHCMGPAHDELKVKHMNKFNEFYGNDVYTEYSVIYGTAGTLYESDPPKGNILCYWGTGALGVLGYPNDGIVDMNSATMGGGQTGYSRNWGFYACHGNIPSEGSLYSFYVKRLLEGNEPIAKNQDKIISEGRPPQLCYVNSDSVQAGQSKTVQFQVEENVFSMVYMFASDSNTVFELTSPSQVVFDMTSTTPDSSVVFITDSGKLRGFYIENAESGEWQWQVDAGSATNPMVYFDIFGTFSNQISVSDWQSDTFIDIEDSLTLTITVNDNGIGVPGLSVLTTPVMNEIDTLSEITFFDDGLHGDEFENDGVYGTIVHPPDSGMAKYTIIVTGETSIGPIHRIITNYAYFEAGYLCGDANSDDLANVGDAVYLIAYVFKGGPAPDPVDAGDANCDQDVNVGDAVYLINYVFKGGPQPCASCE